jgi:hypothetical protein
MNTQKNIWPFHCFRTHFDSLFRKTGGGKFLFYIALFCIVSIKGFTQCINPPALNISCPGDAAKLFFVQIRNIAEPANCANCCSVQPTCRRVLSQVSLSIGYYGNLDPAAYNNGCFKLRYSALNLSMQMVKELGGITNLNAARTDACPGQPLSGGANGSNYFLKSNEVSDITTLELGGLYLDQPGEAPPEIIFNNWESQVLFTMVIDYFPGEITNTDGVYPISFSYTNAASPQETCTKFGKQVVAQLPFVYPEPSTTSAEVSLNLGSPDCTDQLATFPLRFSSTGVTAEFLDFKLRLNTNGTAIENDPIITFPPGFPVPTGSSFEPVSGTDEYVLYVYYENASFPAGAATLLTISVEPKVFRCQDFDLTLQKGRLVTQSGCYRPAGDNLTSVCTGQCPPPCNNIPFVLQANVPLQQGLCAAAYTAILNMADLNNTYNFDRIQFQIDFDLDADVSITSAVFSNPSLVSQIVGNSVIFNSTGVSWNNNLYLTIDFSGQTGCINNAVFREFAVIPQSANEYCSISPSVESFPFCMRKASGIIATEGGCRVNGVTVNFTPAYADPNYCYSIPTMTVSNCDGYEACLCPVSSTEWTIIPEKNDDLYDLPPLTEADLMAIQQHILNFVPLGSPYRMIAADATNDGIITTYDIVELRRLMEMKYGISDPTISVLGPWPSDYAPSWRFIPADYIFPAPNFPFAPFYPYGIVTDLPADNLNFVAVKTGAMLQSNNNTPLAIQDCINGHPCNDQLRPVQKNFNVKLDMTKNEVDGLVTVPVTALNPDPLVCWQMGIQFDDNLLEFVAVQNGDLTGITEDNYHVSRSKPGEIRISWTARLDHRDDHLHRGDVFFNLVFKIKSLIPKGVMPVHLSNDVLACKAWLMDFTLYDLMDISDVRAGERGEWNIGNALNVVCRPNPVDAVLYMDISIEKADMGSIQVFDILGRLMVGYRQNLQAGSQSYLVPEAANWPVGTYQWRVKTDSGSFTQGLLIKQ